MELPHLVITYPAAESVQLIFREVLAGAATCTSLADLPSGARGETLSRADVLCSWNPKKELGMSEFSLLSRVRLIQLMSAGADHIPFSVLRPQIAVAANIGAYAAPMAEHVVAMTFALAKNLLIQHRRLERGEFNQSILNRTLQGAVCGIIGFGGIGRASGRLLSALGLRIHAINSSGRTDQHVEFIGTLSDLRHVLTASDVVVISVPLNRTTRGLIGKRELDWMKPDAILINIARGEIIDEDALYAHLQSHPDFRAGIDAWWVEPFRHGEFRMKYPFLELPNLLGSPHNSAMVPGILEESARKAAQNIKRFLNGEPLSGLARRDDYV